MKILFAGPSLARTIWVARTSVSTVQSVGAILCRGPAEQGDVSRAVEDGASAIGLVDGRFGDVAAVWHKEILFALSEGVTVLGAASMGALRAAECSPYGMVGIGEIYRRYADGRLLDDDAVAQLHAPEELGFIPLTEPLVNAFATFDRLADDGLVTADERARLSRAAEKIFFGHRTHRAIAAAVFEDPERARMIASILDAQRVDLKRADALELISRLIKLPPDRGTKPAWQLARTSSLSYAIRR